MNTKLCVWISILLICIVPALATPINWSNKLMAYYSFDMINGNTVYDSSPNGNNGTFKNGALINTSGFDNSAVSLDGVNDYVNISRAMLGSCDNRTYAAWVKYINVNGSIIGGETGQGDTNLESNQFYCVNSSYNFAVRVGTSWTCAESNVHPGAGWDFVVGTWNGTSSAGNLSVYVNGVMKASRINVQCPFTYVTAKTFNIGFEGSTGTYFGGLIDEVSIWNRTLSPSEVSTLWNGGAGSFYPSNLIIDSTTPANKSQYAYSAINYSVTYHTTVARGDDVNCTLYINNTLSGWNDSTSSSATLRIDGVSTPNGSSNFRINCSEGSVPTDYDSGNTTLIYVDLASPDKNTSFVNNSIYYLANLTAQFNISDNILLYDYNISVDGTQVFYNNSLGGVNSLSFNISTNITALSVSNHTLTIKLCDGQFSELNCISRNNPFYRISATPSYNNPIYNGLPTTLSLVVNNAGLISNATLWWNDTQFTPTKSVGAGYDSYIYYVTVPTTISYAMSNWSFDVNGYNFTTNNINQTVSTTILIINVTDETTGNKITQSISVWMNNNISSTNKTFYNQTNFTNYDRAAQIYFAASTPYAARTYNLPAPTSGVTYLNAYLINSSLPTVHLVTFSIKDYEENILEGVDVNITKLYGTSLVQIASPKSNFQGQFQEYMDSSTNYNFFVYILNFVNRSFNLYPSDSSYTLFMNPITGTVNVSNITTNIIYSNITGNITVTWNDTTPYTSGVIIDVTRETVSGTLTICNTTISGSNGIYVCNVISFPGVIHVVVSSNESGTQIVKTSTFINTQLPPLSLLIGEKEGAWWSFGIVLTCAAFGLFSPVGAVIATILGLIMVYALGLTSVVTITFIIIACMLGIIVGIKVRT